MHKIATLKRKIKIKNATKRNMNSEVARLATSSTLEFGYGKKTPYSKRAVS